VILADTHAKIGLRALSLIEASSAAYYGDRNSSARHEYRAVQDLKQIADALGFRLVPKEKEEAA